MLSILKDRRLIIIGIAIITIVGLALLLIPKGDDNKPKVSKVPQGETVVPTNTPAPGASSLSGGSVQSAITPPTTEQLSDTIQSSKDYLTGPNGQPTFGIISVKNPLPGWYVVTVRVQNAGEPGKVILQQTDNPNNPLTVVSGPATSFPPEYVSIPDAVRSALK